MANRWKEAEDFLRQVDPLLGPLIDKYGPCRLQPSEHYFDNLCESVICQQISTKAAESILQRFRALSENGVVEPEELAKRSDEELRKAGLSAQKVKYIRDLTDKVLSGELDLAHVATLPSDLLEKQLLKVKGIGPWTVTMFLIFALNRTDILPVGDLGIRKAMQNLYGFVDLPNPEEMREIAKPWHPYESVASWYLWRSLENKTVQ